MTYVLTFPNTRSIDRVRAGLLHRPPAGKVHALLVLLEETKTPATPAAIQDLARAEGCELHSNEMERGLTTLVSWGFVKSSPSAQAA